MKDKEPEEQNTTKSDIERHVDEMLDVNVTESASTPAPTPAPAAKKKVTITHIEEEPSVTTAPPLKKSAAKKAKAITVIAHEEPEAPKEAVTNVAQSDQTEQTADEQTAEVVDDQTVDAVEAEVTTAPVLPTEPKELAPETQLPDTAKEAQDDLAAVAIAATEDEPVEAPSGLPDKQALADPVLSDDDLPLTDTLNEPVTNKAVDDIIAKEADELLAVQDEVTAAEQEYTTTSWSQRIKDFLLSAKLRWAVFLLIVAGGIGAGAVPSSRYAVLNMAGVRAEASVYVTDQSTFQPLKNVSVRIGDITKQTDAEGNAKFDNLRLGPTSFSVSKKAFAPIDGSVTIGWGSNPLGERKLSPAGVQYSFVVTDFLSGKPIADASVSAGQADAAADERGKLRLTLEHSDALTTEVTLTAPGYRAEKLTLDLSSKLEIAVKMVPDKKAVFVSKRSGNYDVYKIDIDGKNETILMAGTGLERDDIAVSLRSSDNLAAVVSTRDNKRNADGYLLSTLTLINVTEGTTRTVTQSEQISIVGWVGNNLVYVQIAAGTSAANPNRQRLMSYDFKQNNNKQIASTNYFNDVLVAGNYIYYAPSSTYQTNASQSHLFRVNPDGTNKQTILGTETWNIIRSDYETLLFSVPGEWYDYRLGAVAAKKLDGQPANQVQRIYSDSPDKTRSAWIDQRDGKGTLLLYDVQSKKEKTLLGLSGLKYPLNWLNDKVIVYRLSNDGETADYAVSLDGGEPIKIRDVTATNGVDKWYYY